MPDIQSELVAVHPALVEKGTDNTVSLAKQMESGTINALSEQLHKIPPAERIALIKQLKRDEANDPSLPKLDFTDNYYVASAHGTDPDGTKWQTKYDSTTGDQTEENDTFSDGSSAVIRNGKIISGTNLVEDNLRNVSNASEASGNSPFSGQQMVDKANLLVTSVENRQLGGTNDDKIKDALLECFGPAQPDIPKAFVDYVNDRLAPSGYKISLGDDKPTMSAAGGYTGSSRELDVMTKSNAVVDSITILDDVTR
jgi:hypothetical protein